VRTLDAARIIPRFRAPTSLTVKRKSTGTFTKGRYTPAGSETTFTVENASVQPLAGKELLQLAEGFRTKEVKKVYSPVELRTADAEAGHEADRVVYKGETYEVHDAVDWDEHGKYWKCLIVKVGQ
jgi:hypothetical protein